MSDEYIWPPPLSEFDKTQKIIEERDALRSSYNLMDMFLAEMMIDLKHKNAETGRWQQAAEMLYFSCKRAQESGAVSPLDPAIEFYEKTKAAKEN